MKISVQTGATTDVLGLDAGFAAIKAAGFEAVDYGLDGFYTWDDAMAGKRCEFFDNEEGIAEYIKEIKAVSEKYGVAFGQFHAPFPSYFPKKPEPTAIMLEMIQKSIMICGECGCPHIVVHPCFDGSARFPSLTKEQEYQLNIEFYSSLIPYLKKYHVTCCLENMWCQDWKSKKIYTACCSDIDEACRYIDDLNAIAGEKCFAFCLDVGHLLLLGIDPCNAIEKLGDRLEALHVHDNNGIDDGHTAPYLGVCNWNRFMKGLREIGYKGNMNFETANINRLYPKELVPDVLKLLGATASYFRDKVLAED